ncbi:MAG: hypothetical protein H0V46_00425 [Sphingomonas sp.]|nr:hypothetical protein [Sphingomonas sp.]
MRYSVPLAALFVAGCTPDVERPEPPSQQPPSSPVVPQASGGLIGLTAAELVQRFGSPALQIREGQSLKLQFRGRGCVLDAYLYLPGSGQGVQRVTHVDARLPSGADIDQRACIGALRGS